MEFQTRYAGKRKVSLARFGPTRAKQSFRDECDINVIMRRYTATGIFPAGVGVAKYGDFSSVTDYFESMQLVLRTREQFEALPASVRERFGNDPSQLLAFVSDRKNLAEAGKLGLLKDEQPVKAEPLVKGPAQPAPAPAQPA